MFSVFVAFFSVRDSGSATWGGLHHTGQLYLTGLWARVMAVWCSSTLCFAPHISVSSGSLHSIVYTGLHPGIRFHGPLGGANSCRLKNVKLIDGWRSFRILLYVVFASYLPLGVGGFAAVFPASFPPPLSYTYLPSFFNFLWTTTVRYPSFPLSSYLRYFRYFEVHRN